MRHAIGPLCLALLLCTACSDRPNRRTSPGGGGGLLCIPDSSRDCDCGGETTGEQTCSADGGRWLACVCPDEGGEGEGASEGEGEGASEGEGEGGGEGEGEGAGEGEGEGGPGEGEGEEPGALIPEFRDLQVVLYYPRDDPDRPETALYLAGPITPERAAGWHEDRVVPGPEDDTFLTPLTRNPETGESLLVGAASIVSPDGRFVAWAEVDPGTGEQELWIAPVQAGWSIRFDLKRRAASAGPGRLLGRRAGFSGEWLVYGLVHGDRGTVYAQRAADGHGDHLVQELPLGGGFIVGPAGAPVVTLEVKTLASMTVWSAAVSGEANPILLHLFEVEGASTGSDYSGAEPGAVSPDGRHVALVTSARERLAVQAELSLHILATDRVVPGRGHVGSVRLGPAGQGACTIPREHGEYVAVDVPPVWSPDGRFLYVLARSPAHCGARSYDVDDTAILRVAVADNGQLGEVTNLTPIPPDWDHPRRVAFHELALSPDGDLLVVTATPPDRVRSRDLFCASARLHEVYTELLVEDQDAMLFQAMVRLTSSARHLARSPKTFPLR